MPYQVAALFTIYYMSGLDSAEMAS